eukprot:m.173426 g.173426  ORF g.173426 m.173426 type:complete len:82 (-) comp18299_c2_seq10:119-364(-)
MSWEAEGGRRLTATGECVERAVEAPWKARDSPKLKLEWLNFGAAVLDRLGVVPLGLVANPWECLRISYNDNATLLIVSTAQ